MTDLGVSDLAEEIKKSDTQELALRLATVESIETTTVTVRVAGSTNTASGVDYVGYAPKVGDVVLVFQNGPNLIIWGIPGSTGGIPTGSIIAYGSATAPPGYLLCNGQSTSGYAALAAVVGANVPNLVEKFVVGAGGGYAQGATGGVASNAGVINHTHILNAHQHNQTAHTHPGFNHTHSVGPHTHPQVVTAAVGGPGVRADYQSDASSGVFPQGVSTGQNSTFATGADGSAYNTGSGGGGLTGNGGVDGGGGTIPAPSGGVTSLDNRPPYYALTYIIKT